MGRKGSVTVQLRVNIKPWVDKGLQKIADGLGGWNKSEVVVHILEQALNKHGIYAGIGDELDIINSKQAAPASAIKKSAGTKTKIA